ncbi:hypothetical protein NDU88_008054 [Pleurodeles waltl]|uniref:Uncharacterized protein n=1 Tax=Pleurodeles waltl TaxID=8319 RepID=A0AAV7VRF7_PLEWA|nr:hypothetical protein NDU88_008054 [Pleurodeles waltl]
MVLGEWRVKLQECNAYFLGHRWSCMQKYGPDLIGRVLQESGRSCCSFSASTGLALEENLLCSCCHWLAPRERGLRLYWQRRTEKPLQTALLKDFPSRLSATYMVTSHIGSSTVRAVKVERTPRLSSVSLATLRRLTQALHVHFPCYAHAGGPVSASVSYETETLAIK